MHLHLLISVTNCYETGTPLPEFSQLIKFCDMSHRIGTCAPARLRESCEGLFARMSTCHFTIGFSKSNFVPPCFLQWSTFILKQPSHKFCKRSNLNASVLRIKVHFDIQKLTIKFDIAFVRFVSRPSRLHTCVFDSCGLSQPSHEICTSSFSNLCLARVFYTLAFWNC